MEKFSKWTDKGTGIHPFVPHKARPRSLPAKLAHCIVAPVLLLLRLPLAALVFLLWAVLRVVLPVRPIVRALDASLLRALLLLLGFWRIDATLVEPSIAAKKRAPVRPPHLIVANLCSYIDILYLTCRYSPTFAFPDTRSGVGSATKVFCMGAWQALRAAAGGVPPCTGSPVECGEAYAGAKRTGVPLVFFTEGTSTNGLAMLKCFPFTGLEDASNVGLVGLSYPALHFSPCHVGTTHLAGHVLQLCCQVYNQLTVREMPCAQVAAAMAEVPPVALPASITTHLTSRLLRTHELELSALHKADFLAYWRSYHTQYEK